jgi:hypothetical protein
MLREFLMTLGLAAFIAATIGGMFYVGTLLLLDAPVINGYARGAEALVASRCVGSGFKRLVERADRNPRASFTRVTATRRLAQRHVTACSA